MPDKAHEAWDFLSARDESGARRHPQVVVDERLVTRYFHAVTCRQKGTTEDDVARCLQAFQDLRRLDPEQADLGLLYTTAVFNELLLVVSRQQGGTKAKVVLHLFYQLITSKRTYPGFQPNQFTFPLLITIISRNRTGAEVNDAIKLFRRVVEVNAEGDRLFPDMDLNT